MLFRKKVPIQEVKKPFSYSPERPELYWEQVADKLLTSGVSPDGHRIYNVRMSPGRTKDDLVCFLSRIKPCPEWDAAVAAEFKDLIIITNSGKTRNDK